MENKIVGKYYLVEVPEWNEAGFAVARYENGARWTDVSSGSECTSYVKAYKAVDKVGKMLRFAVLHIPKDYLKQ